MLISDAQRDLRRAYVGGGPGVMISGLIWLVATVVQLKQGIGAGFTALFFGGMLIFPITKLLCRFLFRRDSETPGNPFGLTVLECTIAMIGGLFAAWLFLPSRPMLTFPLAAVAVGTHYCVFATAYGNRWFWLIAGIVTAIGCGDIFLAQMHGATALLVTVTELVFGLALTIGATRSAGAAVATAG
jgi:hypothetical protein